MTTRKDNSNGDKDLSETQPTLIAQGVEALRAEGTTVFARTSVWAAGALIVLAVSGWSFYLRDYFNRQFPQLPPNALVAFEAACPDGSWESLTERNSNAAGAYLRIASSGIAAEGGANAYTLTKSDIPLLQLFSTQDLGVAKPAFWGLSGPQGQGKLFSFSARDDGHSGTALFEFSTLFVGSGAPNPVKIEPKYITVVLCRKKA